MTSPTSILSEAVERLFVDLTAAVHSTADASPARYQQHWAAVEELGIPKTLVPEVADGFGGSWLDAFVVCHLVGLHALPLPVGEALVGRWLLAVAHLELPDGGVTLGTCPHPQFAYDPLSGAPTFSGELPATPWGAESAYVVVACAHPDGERLVVLASADATCSEVETTLAGEPRSHLRFTAAPLVTSGALPDAGVLLTNGGALLRTAQISGALEAILALCVAHVKDRVQFGKPLGAFQAIQHQLALLAEEVAAVKCAAQAAFRAAALGDAAFELAAAKLRANRAITQATSIAHQVHGAMGFTMEHRLHRFTQRLWTWRSEYGNDRYWADILGRSVLANGADRLWSNLTSRGDRGHG